jgi:sugar lactone lactonase YvrE
MTYMIHDDTNCLLGEGPLWHPERAELFWFDILARRLHRKGQHWDFDCHASAAGWVDNDRLVIATARDFRLFDIETGYSESLCPLEADNPTTRSNDGRVDPWGGFWIGTMGIRAEEKAGAIYRWFKGELRTLYPGISIPNSICFAPDGSYAYWTDTFTGIIMRQRLNDADGWPLGDAEPHVDLRGSGFHPDGSVVDAAGNLWNAQWGSGRVAVYGPEGTFKAAHALPASQTTCPAFGGADMSVMYCTSAACGLPQEHLADSPHTGRTFAVQTDSTGQREHRVIL